MWEQIVIICILIPVAVYEIKELIFVIKEIRKNN